MTTWTIGSATITRVEELLGITNQPCEKYFPNFERDVLERHIDWLAPHHYSIAARPVRHQRALVADPSAAA